MPICDRQLPPLRTVQLALQKTTEALAHSLADLTGETPHWSDFEWCVAKAAAALHGVSGILSRRFPSHALDGPVPADWQVFLAEQRAHIAKRHMRICSLVHLIDDRARAADIPFVALKGAALYELGLYESGERPMADLDVLIRAEDADRMADILHSADFRQTTETWKHRVLESVQGRAQAIFGEDRSNPLKVDLHVRICEHLPRRPVDVTSVIMAPQPRAGLNPYSSSPALMLHLLLHAAGAVVLRTLRLVQLHDLALLSRKMTPADWKALLSLAAAARCGLWWAHAPLQLVAHYYRSVPAEVLAAAASECRPSLLRRSRRQCLWEVSFSDLRRRAFPGIEWSLSLDDRLVYAMQRGGLGLNVLARTLLTGTVSSGADGIGDRGGRHLPARGWIGLRPARPATLLAVREALALRR